MPHEEVIKRVLEGKADAGFVRTGVIEAMVQEGRLRPDEITVINAQSFPKFNKHISTHLYPEWPLVALSHTDQTLVRHLTATILDVNKNNRYFFTFPSNYTPIELVLQELRLPPFDQAPEFTLTDIWRRYSSQIIIGLTLFLLIAILTVRLMRVNANLEQMRRKVDEEARLRANLLNTMTEGVYGVNQSGICIIANPAAQALLGYSAEELIGHRTHALFHHHHANGAPYPDSDCPILKTLQDEQPRACEDWYIRKNGEGFPVSLRVASGQLHDKSHYAVVVFHDISKRKADEQKLHYLAKHDILTGLPNRSVFDDRLTHAMVFAKRDKTHVGLIYIDLDKFKPINDTFGHHMGDRILIEVAQRILGVLRESDTSARVGGDEFVVLLPNISSLQDATMVANKLLEVLRLPYRVNETIMHLSASIGVAVDLDQSCDEITLKHQADAAMYQAKQLGRNNVSVYQSAKKVQDWNI